MNAISISVDKFYLNKAYYPYIPASVFDALEEAFVAGRESADISEDDYQVMLSNLKSVNLCPGL